MRVAVDARELCGRPTGVGRYLSELLLEWARSPEARRHEWCLYLPSAPAGTMAPVGRVRVLPGSGGTRWEQWTLMRALNSERPDVLFAPGYSAPFFAPCPVVVAIHDVSFAAHPEWYAPREGLRRRIVTGWSARRARLVLTISEFSRSEIVRWFAIPPTRIRVTHLGHRLRQAGVERPKEPLVLYVGTIFERRRVDRLVAAFATAVAPAFPDATLEIVGEDRATGAGAIARMQAGLAPEVRSRVRLRSYVDEATLADLYARASVFAFLSEYEGFGLTPLEAMAAGATPVVLDTPVAREIYGKAAWYVPSNGDFDGRLGAALVTLVGDEGARARLSAEAPAVLSRYDWSRTAAETLAALEDAAGAR
jgi:glycosyltransferase involved in cell wall biosynthesis